MRSDQEIVTGKLVLPNEHGISSSDTSGGWSESEPVDQELHAEACGTSDIFNEEYPGESLLEESGEIEAEDHCCGEEESYEYDLNSDNKEYEAVDLISAANNFIDSNETGDSLFQSLLQSVSNGYKDNTSFSARENITSPLGSFNSNSGFIPSEANQLRLVSGPGSRLNEALREGDLIVKKIPGYGKHSEGVLVENKLVHSSELVSDPSNRASHETGFYGKIIENYPFKHGLDNPHYRRLVDNLNITPKDTYILRMPRETQDSNQLMETGGTFRKIRAREVQYLALEGGGGKGFAFIGAIQKLEQIGVIRFRNRKLDQTRLKGIAGASAGAISAVFLALGHNSSSITSIMNSVNFNSFFDLPRYRRKIPRIGGCYSGSEGSFLRTMLFTITSVVRRIPVFGNRAASYVADKFRDYLSSPRRSVNTNSGPLQKMLAHWPLYIRNLIEDFGIFSGCAARDFFDRKIAEKFNGRRNVTFSQMYAATRVNLVLTTVNVESGNSEYLSHETTPNLPVADAVRMSMSLPYIYKPYKITATQAARIGNRRLAGLYVDGGTRNNIPIRAFQRFVRGGIPNTLGLRLELDKQGRIDNILKFFLHYSLMPGLMGTGESNISITSGYSEQTISLDTTGLSTLDFNPPSSVRTAVINRSRQAVTQYFR